MRMVVWYGMVPVWCFRALLFSSDPWVVDKTSEFLRFLQISRPFSNRPHKMRRTRSFCVPFVVSYFTTLTITTGNMKIFSISVLFFVTISGFPRLTHSLSVGECSASATTFFCPNCDGIQVTDCLECDGFLSTDTRHNMCIDRRLFQRKNTDREDPENHYHFLLNDLLGTIVWFVTAGIAMACGVGGGGVYVPLGILLLQFAPKPASGLSQASIFGASLGGLLLNGRHTHPFRNIRHDAALAPEEESKLGLQRELRKHEKEQYEAIGGKYYTRPLIDFDMALFLSPMAMAGAVLGVLVQKILPNWAYLLIAVLVLSLTSRKTYKKFFSVHEKEKKAREEAAKEEENCNKTSHGSRPDSESPGLSPEEAAVPDSHFSPEDEENLRLRKQYLEHDMRQYPKEKILGLVILWIGLFLLTLMKGGKGVDSIVGITCESPMYAALIVMQFLWMSGFALMYGFKLKREQTLRKAVNYPFFEADPVWDLSSMKTYGFFTFLAGVVGGLIGIGGGMVLGPLMLIMGVDPRVSSAANATMVVLTSSSVAVMFVTSGQVPLSYALFFFSVCFCGAYLGKSTIDGHVKRTGRASFLIFILATIIAFATLGCMVILVTRLAEQDWCFDGFRSFCDISDGEDACISDRLLREFEAGLA